MRNCVMFQSKSFDYYNLNLYINGTSKGCKKPREFSVSLKPTMRCWCKGSI